MKKWNCFGGCLGWIGGFGLIYTLVISLPNYSSFEIIPAILIYGIILLIGLLFLFYGYGVILFLNLINIKDKNFKKFLWDFRGLTKGWVVKVIKDKATEYKNGKVIKLFMGGKISGVSIPNFKIIPGSIGTLKSLKDLTLYKTKVKTLPESIGNLKSLETLSLNENNLITLPRSIGNLKSLKQLFLSNNSLTSLPESIGELTSLEYLGLGFNNLKKLPRSIENLKSLKRLDLTYAYDSRYAFQIGYGVDKEVNLPLGNEYIIEKLEKQGVEVNLQLKKITEI